MTTSGKKPATGSASVPRAPVIAILTTMATLGLVGCSLGESSQESEGERPSSDRLTELREYSHKQDPLYWLGDRFHGLEISGAELTREGASVSYGKRNCEGSGCTEFPLSVHTYIGWPNPFRPPAPKRYTCFEHIRGGILITDCRIRERPNWQGGVFWIGPRPGNEYGSTEGVDLNLSGLLVRHGWGVNDLARAVVPMDVRSTTPRPLPPPEPPPCPRVQYLVRWWLVTIRREFGVNPRCDLNQLLGLS